MTAMMMDENTRAELEQMFLNFRHDVDAEPSTDWTVGEVFQYSLMRSIFITNKKFELLEDGIRQNFEDGLLALENPQSGNQNNCCKTNNTENPAKEGDADEKRNPELATTNEPSTCEVDKNPLKRVATSESYDHNNKTNKTSEVNTAVSSSDYGNKFSYTIRVYVAEGQHAGKEYELAITKSKEALIGRSKGKKYRDGKGISLYKDLEVSTMHGKFVVKDNKPCFIDTESSNGTRIILGPKAQEAAAEARKSQEEKEEQGRDEDEMVAYSLVPHDFYPLETGTQLICGQSRLQITVV